MSVKVTGMDKVLKELERRIGNDFEPLSKRGLKKASDMFVDTLRKELQSIKGEYRTGATVEEIDLHGPIKKNGEWVYTVRWKGPNNRYALIHLNEWGTVRNPNPQMKGAIARVLKNTEDKYYKILADEIRRGLK